MPASPHRMSMGQEAPNLDPPSSSESTYLTQQATIQPSHDVL